MDTPLLLPPPDQLRQRISDCESELRSLRRLLRLSKNMQTADEARARRADSTGETPAGEEAGRV